MLTSGAAKRRHFDAAQALLYRPNIMTTLDSISLATVFGGQEAGQAAPPATDEQPNSNGMINPAGTTDVLGMACRPAPQVGEDAWLCKATGAKWKAAPSK